MKKLGKYSFGTGDRFGMQGEAQLSAIAEAARKGVEITIVWNKSNREHQIIGTLPEDVRNEADIVTSAIGWSGAYFVDADHINLETVDPFINSSDFFTIDVASFIGNRANQADISKFISDNIKYGGDLFIPGIDKPLSVTEGFLKSMAENYLFAIQKAGEIYRHIEEKKGVGNFITEVSMDEVAEPQSPVELLFILSMLANIGIPVQTIAPKFSGRFNKGVDYSGDIDRFAEEFEADLMVVDYAVKKFGMAEDLKLSIHSGSDKFSIYPHIGRLIRKHDKGIHIKTAGTTWLEEVIGLSLAGGVALDFVKELYYEALDKSEELCAPYADVIDIDVSMLPGKKEVEKWNREQMSSALRHEPEDPEYNPSMRQLMHVSYKLAADRITEFARLADNNSEVIGRCVFDNLYERHLRRIFEF
ncbi:MAG: tagaturonate epimerase family protein [Bacteroidales bacterium]|nr:tagaturonate epimerase family protein [Bacteroidales bacterium]